MTIDPLVLTFQSVVILACATGEVNPAFKVRPPHLCTRIWVRAMIGLVKKAIVDLPIRLKGNSGNSLSPLAQNKDLDAASQTLLTEAKLRL